MNFVRIIGRHERIVHLGNKILSQVQLVRKVPPNILPSTLAQRNSLIYEFVKENDKMYEEWENNRRAIQRYTGEVPSR